MVFMARDARYQFQPWYMKLWRCRHFLRLPWDTLLFRLYGESWKHAYSIARGYVDVARKCAWRLSELQARRPELFGDPDFTFDLDEAP